MADALVIASVAGGVLFEKAQKEYMRRAPRPYMKIINAIMSHDLTGGHHLFRGSCLPTQGFTASQEWLLPEALGNRRQGLPCNFMPAHITRADQNLSMIHTASPAAR